VECCQDERDEQQQDGGHQQGEGHAVACLPLLPLLT